MAASISADQNLKTTLEAMSPQELDALKRVTMYYRLRRSLRASGWTNIVWGSITLWFGFSVLLVRSNIFSSIQAILGFLIVAQSLWSIARPGTRGFLGLMSILLFCGLWNLFIAVIGGQGILIAILGLFQLWWAYQSYQFYQLFSAQPLPKPTAQQSKQYDDIWSALAHPSATLSPELMTIQLGRNRHWWRTLLLPEHALLAHKRQKALMLFSKPELVIFPDNPKTTNRDNLSVFVLLNNETLRGKMYPGGLQQYLAWKGVTDEQAEETGLFARKRFIYRAVRVVLVIAALIIMFYCAQSVNIITHLSR